MTATTDWINESLTFEEALKRVRQLSRKRRLRIHARQDARIDGDDNHCYQVSGSVEVSLRIMLRYIDDAYKHICNRRPEIRIRISYCDTLLFVG